MQQRGQKAWNKVKHAVNIGAAFATHLEKAPQVFTVLALLVHTYLLTGTKVQTAFATSVEKAPQVRTLLAFLVQKYEY